MGLLRLLTNESVMDSGMLTLRNAWRAYETMLGDERVQFAHEPIGLETEWRTITQLDKSATKFWTDAYLIAFARTAGVQLVTLDRAIAAAAPEALILG